MNKIAVFLTILLASGLGAVKFCGVAFQQPFAVGGSRKVDERFMSYRLFKGSFDAAIDDLASGAIRLPEAYARVASAAKQFHPDHFEQLQFAQKGDTDEERLIHNLIEHVHALEVTRPQVRQRFASLRREARAFLMGLPK